MDLFIKHILNIKRIYNRLYWSTIDYKVNRNIEEIMEYIRSRQDYTNYVLGYPNTVVTDSNSGSTTNCTYTVNGTNMSGIKVKLVHAKNSAVPGVNTGDEIEGQELVDFENIF